VTLDVGPKGRLEALDWVGIRPSSVDSVNSGPGNEKKQNEVVSAIDLQSIGKVWLVNICRFMPTMSLLKRVRDQLRPGKTYMCISV